MFLLSPFALFPEIDAFFVFIFYLFYFKEIGDWNITPAAGYGTYHIEPAGRRPVGEFISNSSIIVKFINKF